MDLVLDLFLVLDLYLFPDLVLDIISGTGLRSCDAVFDDEDSPASSSSSSPDPPDLVMSSVLRQFLKGAGL